jgi:hypothetical protein
MQPSNIYLSFFFFIIHGGLKTGRSPYVEESTNMAGMGLRPKYNLLLNEVET